MMKLAFSFAVGLVTAVCIAAQAPASTPPSQPQTQQTPQPIPAQAARITPAVRFPGSFPLNPVSDSDRLASRVIRLQWIIAPLYRKPGSKETAVLLPNSTARQAYASFVRSEGAGIIKLATDRGCVFSDQIVSVKEECLRYSFPGAGNSYSFRTESYRLRHLADLTYSNDKLRITGVFMHGISVALGDVPIEGASLTTPGMKFLVDFRPSTSSDNVMQVEESLVKGLKRDNFVYSKEVVPELNRSYAIRSIAYRGRVIRSAAGVRYNELDYDKRRDVIVVFRVVEMDSDGVTIVWKKLADTETPRIRMPKAEKEADDGEAN